MHVLSLYCVSTITTIMHIPVVPYKVVAEGSKIESLEERFGCCDAWWLECVGVVFFGVVAVLTRNCWMQCGECVV